MKTINKTIELQTKSQFDIIDLTEKVRTFLKESKIKNGLINIQSLRTTATVFMSHCF